MEKNSVNPNDYISLRLEFEECSESMSIQFDKRYVKNNENKDGYALASIVNEPRVDKVKYMLQYDYKGKIMLGLTTESDWVKSKSKNIGSYCFEPASRTFYSNESLK